MISNPLILCCPLLLLPSIFSSNNLLFVFLICYSSKDIDKVTELCELLEEQGFECFVAARNLRHGKGAVEDYNKALESAMDHSKCIVFVSSMNSRSFSCDALTIELPYIQGRDIENSPAEHRNNYKGIPQQYKKPRVEYRIEESRGFNAADSMSNEFFDGYERVYSCEAVAERVAAQIFTTTQVKSEKKPAVEEKKVKYCVACLAKCPEDAKFCMECGGKQFASTHAEAELMQRIAKLENEKAEREEKSDKVADPAAK